MKPAKNHLKIRPKKSLGQNYLVDDNIGKKIAGIFNINRDDKVLEIGPGNGEITRHILNYTENITAIELDINNFNKLKENFPGLNVINADFLTVDLDEILNSFDISKNEKLRIIGNIPYNISSDILFKLAGNHNIIRDAQLMMQEELAQRIVAVPSTKDYSRLSIMIQIFCAPELLFKVSRSCFYPKPNVDSRIIHFDFEKNRLDEINNIGFLGKFVKTAFMSRRKMLRHTMNTYNIDVKTDLPEFDFTRRIESFSISEIISLCNKLSSIIHR